MAPRKWITLALVLVVLAGCSSGGKKKPRPFIDPNPEGSPWTFPTDWNESHAVWTDVGPVQVHTRGWPVKLQNTPDDGCAPSPDACVDLDRIADVVNATAKSCGGGFPGVNIYLQPWLLRCPNWAAGCTRGMRIEVTAYYIAWDGRITHYLKPLAHELKHAWRCDGGAR